MPEKPVISNTSPLVCLWGLDLLYLLRELYTEVWIPEEVAKEFSATALTDRQAALDNSPWIRTVRLRRSPSKPSISGIDAGEAAVLALAEEYPPQIILCSPYDEPNAHWIYDTQTGEAIRQPGRRDAGYWYKTQRTGSEQLSLFREEKWDDLHRCQQRRRNTERFRQTRLRRTLRPRPHYGAKQRRASRLPARTY